MTDIKVLAALLREQENVATADKAQFTTWTEHDVQRVFHNEESDRLMRGEHTTLSAAERAEVERLAALAAEDSKN